MLFPFLAQAPRGVAVELVPLERLAEALGPQHDLVAFSAVQSADGRIADVDAIVAAAAAHDVRHVRRHHAGDGLARPRPRRASTTRRARATSGCSRPRGTAYFTLRPELRDGLVPHGAGWYAGEDVPASYYGAPLRLARGRAALRPLARVALLGRRGARGSSCSRSSGAAAIGAHDVAMAEPAARRARDARRATRRSSRSTGCPPTRRSASRPRGIMAAGRGGVLRLSFHLYTTEEDVDRALAVLRSR